MKCCLPDTQILQAILFVLCKKCPNCSTIMTSQTMMLQQQGVDLSKSEDGDLDTNAQVNVSEETYCGLS